MPNFEQAKAYALKRLQEELPDKYTYHSIEHTKDDVVVAATLFADHIGVNGEERMLLLTAAWFHDLGFIETVQGHEEVGVRYAHEVLPEFGYSTEQIEIIGRIIMATKMPQDPQSFLEYIIADADMDSLGREDFFEVANRLRKELEGYGMVMTDPEWYQFEINFLSAHVYFTEAAHFLRDEQKLRNLEKLQDLLEESQA